MIGFLASRYHCRTLTHLAVTADSGEGKDHRESSQREKSYLRYGAAGAAAVRPAFMQLDYYFDKILYYIGGVLLKGVILRLRGIR